MKLIDGKKIAESIRKEIRKKISKLSHKPGLAVVQVGDNAISTVYVNLKQKAAQEVGMHFEKITLDEDVQMHELLNTIDGLNERTDINGFLVQLPLPEHLNEDTVIDSIRAEKDVDGFHPMNMGDLLIGKPRLVPATPLGVIKLIESTGVSIEGKNAVVIGRSNIVGKPVAMLLLHKSATVTVCHSRTKDLAAVCKTADILVVAIGRPKMVNADFVKEGAVVIDVGTSKVDGKIVGDVDFDSVKGVAGYLTPVPGGVGPMTIAMLLDNTLRAYEEANENDQN